MSTETVWLGMDGGGTRLVALAVNGSGNTCARLEVGPSNLRLTSDRDLLSRFQEIGEKVPSPQAIGIGLAGLMTAEDGTRVSKALQSVWPAVPAHITHDLETAWWAAESDEYRVGNPTDDAARIILLSGTGSCCYGRSSSGAVAKVGGWGHWLGDRGSAYALVEAGLRGTISQLDQTGKWGKLGSLVLGRLGLNDPADLIGWVQAASKTEIAALAPDVFVAAAAGDPPAIEAQNQARGHLVADALASHRQLPGPPHRVEFVGSGSVLLAQKEFAASIGGELRQLLPRSQFRLQEREAAWGAVTLARRLSTDSGQTSRIVRPARFYSMSSVPIPKAHGLSPTEVVDPRFAKFDRLSVSQGLQLLLSEEGTVAPAVATQAQAIVKLVRRCADALPRGGRIFYVGAGTSGRLGVLDASECPPTFRTPPEWVQGIIAGGPKALTNAVEGAEDDVAAGAGAMDARQIGSLDVVIGIAASGRTPFVWGALDKARQLGATTALICCHPGLDFPRGSKPSIVVAIPTGPEVLAGSTRLKAGTATKLVLNALTTLTMVQLGKVAGNLMIDLDPSNAKLRIRATRIVAALTGADLAAAESALVGVGWQVSQAAEKLGWNPPRRRNHSSAPIDGGSRKIK